MVPVLKHVLETYFKVESDHERLRLACITAVHEMYLEMRKPVGVFVGTRAATLVRRHLILYSELGARALQEGSHQNTGWLRYRWYPKHHLSSHFEGQVAISGSPAESWCYRDESTIGLCVGVAESCHPKTLHRLISQKYRIE